MDIAAFEVEEWMNRYEHGARHNIAETCVDSLTLGELLALGGTDAATFFGRLSGLKLTYGDIEGSPALRGQIASLYASGPRVIATNGAIGANVLVFLALVGPGDRVLAVHPTYQQLYEVPRALGAQVELVRLRPENAYLPDLAVLRRQMAGRVKLLVLNNPNNPTGALMPRAMLEEIVAMARAAGAYILCDEVYRDLLQPGVEPAPSIVDLYERGVATASMSKVFSLAGLRLGWVASRDGALMTAVLSRRDYTTISCGMIDDHLAAFALGHRDAVLRRSLAIVRENLALLDAWVEAEPAVSYVRPRAGTTALLAFAGSPPSRDLCRALIEERGTLLTPGACFGVEGTARIGFANSAAALRAGLEQVSAHLAGRARADADSGRERSARPVDAEGKGAPADALFPRG